MNDERKWVIDSTRLFSVLNLRPSEDLLEGSEAVDFTPENNKDYKLKSYWDERFKKEKTYEWLGTFRVIKEGFERTGIDFSCPDQEVLVVGCGNSNFSRDLFLTAPHWKIISVDFSAVVVSNMKKRYPDMCWIEQDMTDLRFPPNSFDLILDKAAMDALVADEGSAWEPSER